MAIGARREAVETGAEEHKKLGVTKTDRASFRHTNLEEVLGPHLSGGGVEKLFS